MNAADFFKGRPALAKWLGINGDRTHSAPIYEHVEALKAASRFIGILLRHDLTEYGEYHDFYSVKISDMLKSLDKIAEENRESGQNLEALSSFFKNERPALAEWLDLYKVVGNNDYAPICRHIEWLKNIILSMMLINCGVIKGNEVKTVISRIKRKIDKMLESLDKIAGENRMNRMAY